MSDLKPLKRHLALIPLSQDHHQALMLCWKIRKGLSIGVDNKRIGEYALWMYENQLEPHFKIEEAVVFTVLPSQDELIVKALDDHSELRKLFNSEVFTAELLNKISDKLEAHVRFEERILFQKIQNAASNEQLVLIEKAHGPSECETWHDEFWL